MTRSIATMSAPQLAAAISAAGITMPQGSILPHFLGAGGGGKAGTIEPIAWPEMRTAREWLGAISGRPIGHVRTFVADAMENHHILRGGERGKYHLLSTIGDQAVLVPNMTGAQMRMTVIEMLAPQDHGRASGLGFDLSRSGACALFALIDRVRLLAFCSLMERKGLQSAVVDHDDLAAQIDAGVGNADNRWLCTLFGHLLGEQLSTRDLEAGCAELVEMGHIAPITTDSAPLYRPSDSLIAAAIDLLIPLPAMLLTTVDPPYSAMLVSGQSLWLIRTDMGKFRFENISSASAGRLTRNVISRILEPHAAEDGKSRSRPMRPQQPVGLQEPAEQATSTVEVMPQPEGRQDNSNVAPSPEMRCPQCGVQAGSMHRFCTGCGSSLVPA
ncbi:MAG: hypothetical protein ABIL01_14055 [Pseudomonadota bacterium]